MRRKLTIKQVLRGAVNLARAKTKPITATSSERFGICMRCENLERVTLRCRLCGCPVKELAKLADKHCDIGKW